MPFLEPARLPAASIAKLPQILNALHLNPLLSARKLVSHFLEETGVHLCCRTVSKAMVAVRGTTESQAKAQLQDIGAYTAAFQ